MVSTSPVLMLARVMPRRCNIPGGEAENP